MKLYTVRKSTTNDSIDTDKENGLSVWRTYDEAAQEVDRLYYTRSIKSYITQD